jgi:hypothetical protein
MMKGKGCNRTEGGAKKNKVTIQRLTPMNGVSTASNIILSFRRNLVGIEHSACIEKDASSMTCYLEGGIAKDEENQDKTMARSAPPKL